jgi:hypothetical protein
MPARTALQSFFAPACVAVIGASTRDASVGRTILANLVGGSYRGRVFAVNPKHSETPTIHSANAQNLSPLPSFFGSRFKSMGRRSQCKGMIGGANGAAERLG